MFIDQLSRTRLVRVCLWVRWYKQGRAGSMWQITNMTILQAAKQLIIQTKVLCQANSEWSSKNNTGAGGTATVKHAKLCGVFRLTCMWSTKSTVRTWDSQGMCSVTLIPCYLLQRSARIHQANKIFHRSELPHVRVLTLKKKQNNTHSAHPQGISLTTNPASWCRPRAFQTEFALTK